MPGSGKPKALRSIPTKPALQNAVASGNTVLGSVTSRPNVSRPARPKPNRSVSPPQLLSLPVPRFQSFDLLATLVAVVRTDGLVLFANAALEDALGI